MVLSDRGVRELRFPSNRPPKPQAKEPVGSSASRLFGQVEKMLGRYFAGEKLSFAALPLDLSACTDFEREVLEACRRIPYGKTVSYSELAGIIQNPKAARAVGNALGRNSVPVIIPCHRIIKSGGDLGWYTPGAKWKKCLLDLERN